MGQQAVEAARDAADNAAARAREAAVKNMQDAPLPVQPDSANSPLWVPQFGYYQSLPAKNEPLAFGEIFRGANNTAPAASGVHEISLTDVRMDTAELQQFCQTNGIEQTATLHEFLKTQLEKQGLSVDFRSEPYGAPLADLQA